MQPSDMKGILQELDSAAKTEFPHGVRFMDLDRLGAEVQPRRDFLVAMSLRHETQHLGLAVRQRQRGPSGSLPFRREWLGQVMGQRRIDGTVDRRPQREPPEATQSAGFA